MSESPKVRTGSNRRVFERVMMLALLALVSAACQSKVKTNMNQHSDLLKLFSEWRTFERPPQLDGAPDYSAETFARRHRDYQQLRQRLDAMDSSRWPIPEQVDWHLVRAEMNGFDFNHRVLKPWVRDPAFYQSIMTERSDVPAHEGPTHHAVTELWTYQFPLTQKEEMRLLADLSVIPPLMRQARKNLTGNARELWLAGIRNMREQRADLDALAAKVGTNAKLQAVIADGRAATDELIAWLESEAPKKNGPSGIGKENYTWYGYSRDIRKNRT